MKIWHLNFELDLYDNFVPIKEFCLDEIQSFNGISKINGWKPIRVRKMENKELSNAPGFYSHIPIFDRITLEKTKDLICDSIEALPLKSIEGEYYIINVIDVLNCIDYDKSKYKTFRDGKKIMRFEKYEFYKDIIKEKHIFKIVDEPLRRPFVSDEFRQRIIECKLKGFKFKLEWENFD